MSVDPLLQIPFHVSEAETLGLTADDLRHRRWGRPFHGIRSLGLADDDILDVALSYLPLLPPGAVFSHSTAARLLGLPVPLRLGDRAPLHVTVPAPLRAPRGRGVVGHQSTLHLEAVLVDILPVAAPRLVLRQCGSQLSVMDLAAMGCVALTGDPFHRIKPVLDPQKLDLDPHPGVPGSARLRKAAPWVRPGPVSRPEGIIDVAVRASGLPLPIPNSLQFAATGERLGWGDEVWPDYRFGIEFQSAWHASPKRMRNDIRRLERWADDDWQLMQLVSDDVFDDLPGTIRRIAARLRARGWTGRVRVPDWVRVAR